MLSRMFTLTLVAICSFTLAMFSYGDSLNAVNVKTPDARLITAGQPDAADFDALKAMGVSKIINLRALGEELPFDESAKAESLGLEYESLPIAGAADVTRENALKLSALLEGEQKVFIHCASGNRVGALLALQAHFAEGMSVDDAIQFGRSAGLTSLESAVMSELVKER